MNSFWVVRGPNADGPTPHATRHEAVAKIRRLIDEGLAEPGEFYIVERDEQGRAVRAFDIDDEVASAAQAR